MNMFWYHRDDIFAQSLQIGFKTFSVGHLAWLFSIAVVCCLCGMLYRRLSESGRDNMRKGISLSILALEAAKIIVMGLFRVNNAEFLPLHLCSLGGACTIVSAMWPRMKGMNGFFAFAFFPAALLAVVFPSTTMYPFWNFYCLHTFLYHALIILYFIIRYMAGEIHPKYQDMWLGYALIILVGLPVYAINGAFNVNYMFLGFRSDVGILATLWDMVTPVLGRPGYAAALALIMLIVVHLFYLIYTGIEKIRTNHR
ncbi:MAG: YwaF family protein [Clostridia bacterium]|nr:YwaF family protein [Clostridia bacterium]